MTQLDMLSYPLQAGYKTGGASQEAAAMVEATGLGEGRKLAVFDHLKSGCVKTAEEIHSALNEAFTLHSVRSALSELLKRGLVEKLEERGTAASKIKIHKWRVI
jgi:Fe2+ or Zn2+ uptake regulation protein